MKILRPVIYLDNNSSTPIDSRVLESMMPYLKDNFANANSSHYLGGYAATAVRQARKQIADLIGADLSEIIFTSGATESINLALKGVAENYIGKGKHIVTVKTEHSAVLDTCKNLEAKGFEITYLPVKEDGLIDLYHLKDALRPDTILVSVMFVNNEIGVLQPLKEIGRIVHQVGALFMTDGTQAVGKIPIDVDELGVDLMGFSGHKIYGPKGIGALYVRDMPDKLALSAQIHGGGHENGLRSGTLNVPGIVALGTACELAQNEIHENSTYITKLRDHLETELLKISNTTVNGSTTNRLYNVSNLCFRGVDSDEIIIGLGSDKNGHPSIAVSNGSACKSSTIEPSHVLMAIGLSAAEAFNSIRFSLGKQNTMDEINTLILAMKNLIDEFHAKVGQS